MSGFAGWKDWTPPVGPTSTKKAKNRGKHGSPGEIVRKTGPGPLSTKAHKFHAKKTKLHGVWFDSMREANRYEALLMRGQAGEIADLELQPRFPIVVNGVKVATYKSDFGYFDLTVQRWIVEDVKSPVTRTLPTYRLKKKLVEALHNIQIVEV